MHASLSSGVTLLEALAHTRRLRIQLSTLHSLCLESPHHLGSVDDSHHAFVSNGVSSKPLDGAGLMRRLTSALSSGGVDSSARPLLRFLTAAASKPALAQLRSWLHRAGVEDPHEEFIVETSGGWGAAAATLETSAAEASVQAWAIAAAAAAALATSAAGLSSSDVLEYEGESIEGAGVEAGVGAGASFMAGFGGAEALDALCGEDDTVGDARFLPPWEGGPPGRLSTVSASGGCGGSAAASEVAWLCDRSGHARHPLLAGLERTVLATGVQLRILQRLPQTAGFAAHMAALGDGGEYDDVSGGESSGSDGRGGAGSSGGRGVEGVSYGGLLHGSGGDGKFVIEPGVSAAAPWVLVFTTSELAEASAQRQRLTSELRRAAEESLAAMATTRAAAAARADARRHSRRAAAAARRRDAVARAAGAASAADAAARARGGAQRREILERARLRSMVGVHGLINPAFIRPI
jgi:hypothetical protein